MLPRILLTKFHPHISQSTKTCFFRYLPYLPGWIISLSQTIKVSHSAGFDEIDQPVFEYIAAPLSAIINCSLSTGIVPSNMKIAKVTPIHKQGPEEELTNLNITVFKNKFLEKVVYIRLFEYIVKKNILHNDQHGYQPQHSTTMSLLNIQDKNVIMVNLH